MGSPAARLAAGLAEGSAWSWATALGAGFAACLALGIRNISREVGPTRHSRWSREACVQAVAAAPEAVKCAIVASFVLAVVSGAAAAVST